MPSWGNVEIDARPADVLAAECARVSAVVLGLTKQEFTLPTRCHPWDVKALIGHVWRDMDRLRTGLAQPAPPSPDTDAVSYWRSYDPLAKGPEIADRAREVAGRFPTGAELALDLDFNWREGVEAAREHPDDRAIATWGPALRLDEFLGTRILEVVVHGLDLAAALTMEPWLTDAGSSITCGILFGLLDADLPEAVGWSELTFIEAGTGRRALTDSEMAALAGLAGRFPLMG